MKATPPRITISTRTATRLALALAAATTILTLLRALAFHLCFEPSLGYFEPPLISSLLYIVPVLLCIVSAALAFLRSPFLPRAKKKKQKKTPEQKREEKKAAKQEKDRITALKRAGVKLPLEPLPTLVPPLRRERTLLTRLADWLCAAAFLAAALIDATTLFPLPRLRVILALISALAFVIPMYGHKLSALSRIAHLAPCAYCIVCIAMDYFDWNTPMNGPVKIGTQLTLCVLILYLNADARLAIADHVIRRRNVCAALVAVLGTSIGIAGVCAIPAGVTPSLSLSPMVISAAVGIHAAISLIPIFHEEIPTFILPPKPQLPSLPKEKAKKDQQEEERQDPV
ncbi:MAG: hypothetical protein IJX62_02780 [Clostridia bacterium]|nr:hypothetical protein [Clostridia bacterium]